MQLRDGKGLLAADELYAEKPSATINFRWFNMTLKEKKKLREYFDG